MSARAAVRHSAEPSGRLSLAGRASYLRHEGAARAAARAACRSAGIVGPSGRRSWSPSSTPASTRRCRGSSPATTPSTARPTPREAGGHGTGVASGRRRDLRRVPDHARADRRRERLLDAGHDRRRDPLGGRPRRAGDQPQLGARRRRRARPGRWSARSPGRSTAARRRHARGDERRLPRPEPRTPGRAAARTPFASAAVDDDGRLLPSSNHGIWVDIGARGSATSNAAPRVAGRGRGRPRRAPGAHRAPGAGSAAPRLHAGQPRSTSAGIACSTSTAPSRAAALAGARLPACGLEGRPRRRRRRRLGRGDPVRRVLRRPPRRRHGRHAHRRPDARQPLRRLARRVPRDEAVLHDPRSPAPTAAVAVFAKRRSP